MKQVGTDEVGFAVYQIDLSKYNQKNKMPPEDQNLGGYFFF